MQQRAVRVNAKDRWRIVIKFEKESEPFYGKNYYSIFARTNSVELEEINFFVSVFNFLLQNNESYSRCKLC